ncbi:MAG: transposase [Candidatus Symbiodolus clandestinus]
MLLHNTTPSACPLRSYDKEFKLNAVKLYHSSGRTCCQLGKELGIPKTTLAAWVRK